jgi:hypothetical protein
MISVSRTVYTLAVFLLLSTGAWAQYPSQVKFLSYNLWGYHNAETPGGYDSLATVINEIDPDVSGRQEVDRVNKRSKRSLSTPCGTTTIPPGLRGPGELPK